MLRHFKLFCLAFVISDSEFRLRNASICPPRCGDKCHKKYNKTEQFHAYSIAWRGCKYARINKKDPSTRAECEESSKSSGVFSAATCSNVCARFELYGLGEVTRDDKPPSLPSHQDTVVTEVTLENARTDRFRVYPNMRDIKLTVDHKQKVS